MSSPEQMLEHLETLVDQLIESAKILLEASKQVCPEDELMEAQKKQEDILQNLMLLDDAYAKTFPEHHKSSKTGCIAVKLMQFQNLNAEFLENLHGKYGFIQFDSRDEKPLPKS